MFVVFTGPDLAGKSTTIEKIWERFNPDVRYKGTRPKDSREAEDTLWRVLVDHIRTGNSYICDRFNFPDEIIYARVFGPQPALRLEDQEAGIQRLMMEIGAFFVYMTADIDVLIQRYKDRGDTHVNEDMIIKAHQNYEDFFHSTQLPYIRIDTTWAVPNQAYEQAWYRIKMHEAYGKMRQRGVSV